MAQVERKSASIQEIWKKISKHVENQLDIIDIVVCSGL